MPVLQNCECIMSWKSVKLCLPVIGSMADLYRWYPVKRSTNQKVYKSKGPHVKRSTSQKVPKSKRLQVKRSPVKMSPIKRSTKIGLNNSLLPTDTFLKVVTRSSLHH